jgi:poly(A) polymerase
MDFPQLSKIVQQQLGDGEKCYLVGGAVRDLILGRDIQDYDFSVSVDPRVLARKVADKLKAAFYVMDPVRMTSRVICETKPGLRQVMDFSALQGEITHDLQDRDFTVNAMAIDLTDPAKIIDPLKGGRDLQEKWLRTTSSSSFISDPVRVIRAARYAASLKLRIESATSRLIENAVDMLDSVSLERQRDELFKILNSPDAIKAFVLLEKFSILEKLGLCLDVEISGHFREFERFESILSSKPGNQNAGFFSAASFQSAFYPLKKVLSSFFESRNSNGHSRFQLDKFFLLIKRSQDRNFELSIMRVFSNDEVERFDHFRKNESYTIELLLSPFVLSNLEGYLFYRQVAQTGIDLILISLARIAGKPAAELDQQKWLEILSRAEQLISIWFLHPEISQPKPFMNGDEIMAALNLQPSPLIGELLEKIKENQVVGNILNREDACGWLRANLKVYSEKNARLQK